MSLKDLKLLHKRFLVLPAQAILARMWGVKDIIGKEVTAKESLVKLVCDKVIGLFGTVMAGVTVDARTEGKVALMRMEEGQLCGY